MTFLENFGIMEEHRNVNNFGMALKTVLQKAKEEGRLVYGVYECAQMLQNIPEDVALCLLPDVADVQDVTANIQHKLVEAYCWENDIEVVKVNNLKKIEKILNDKSEDNTLDVGCVLIQTTKADDIANDFVNNYYSMLVNQSPVVELPD